MIKKIPFDGPIGSGSLPSGPIQIGNDWPGLFVRGDNAMAFAAALDRAISLIPEPPADDCKAVFWSPLSSLRRLSELLKSAVTA